MQRKKEEGWWWMKPLLQKVQFYSQLLETWRIQAWNISLVLITGDYIFPKSQIKILYGALTAKNSDTPRICTGNCTTDHQNPTTVIGVGSRTMDNNKKVKDTRILPAVIKRTMRMRFRSMESSSSRKKILRAKKFVRVFRKTSQCLLLSILR